MSFFVIQLFLLTILGVPLHYGFQMILLPTFYKSLQEHLSLFVMLYTMSGAYVATNEA